MHNFNSSVADKTLQKYSMCSSQKKGRAFEGNGVISCNDRKDKMFIFRNGNAAMSDHIRAEGISLKS